VTPQIRSGTEVAEQGWQCTAAELRDHLLLRGEPRDGAKRGKALGKDSGWEFPSGSSSVTTRVSPVLSDSQLLSYRAAVADLVEEVSKRLGASDLAAAERLVARRLGQPEFACVLSHCDGDMHTTAARLVGEIRRYRPNTRSSASDLPALVRILLLSQIDLVWWQGTPAFESDADVMRSAELVDLMPLRSAKMLHFQYRAQPAGLPGRARDWAQRQALPAIRPRTAGLSFTRSRPVVIAVVNQIAGELAAALPPKAPRPWVTSMVRSVQHQHRLRALGYAAVLPSSHCVGYACDVEMTWFRRFDQHNALARLLLEHQEAGQLNVIDEGQAWHLCVNPGARDGLTAAYRAQLTDR
jgi:hypothetical protein